MAIKGRAHQAGDAPFKKKKKCSPVSPCESNTSLKSLPLMQNYPTFAFIENRRIPKKFQHQAPCRFFISDGEKI